MADTPPVTPDTPEAPPETPPEPKDEKTVPYDRFQQVNQQAKEAKEAQKRLEDRLAELEDRDKSELDRHRAQLEREQKERERLASELAQRDQRLTQLERGNWVRAAAQEAKFIDPEDAVLHASLGEIESERDAKQAVKRIAESKKHLIRQEPERPEIGRVLQGGQPVDPGKPDPAAEENQKFLDELKAASQSGWRAAPGLLDQ